MSAVKRKLARRKHRDDSDLNLGSRHDPEPGSSGFLRKYLSRSLQALDELYQQEDDGEVELDNESLSSESVISSSSTDNERYEFGLEPTRLPKVAQVRPNQLDSDSRHHYNSDHDQRPGVNTVSPRMSPRSRIADGREEVFTTMDGQPLVPSQDDLIFYPADTIAGDHYYALNMEETMNNLDLPDTTLREVKDHRSLQGHGHHHLHHKGHEVADSRFHHRHDVPSRHSHSSHVMSAKPHHSQYSDPYTAPKHAPSSYFPSSLPDYEGYPPSSKVAGAGPRTLGNPVSFHTKMNLSQWQQNLDSQRKLPSQMQHLHLDPPYRPPPASGAGLGMPSSALPSSYPVGDSNMGAGMMGPTSTNLEGLIQASEGMVHERNITIERQKLQIAHLREQVQEMDNVARQRMYARNREESDVLFLKMQEYQYEIASLRAQLAEVSTAKVAEGDQLSRKLGEVEDSYQAKDKIIAELRKELKQTEASLDARDIQHEKTMRDYERLKKKISKMERYMDGLPTAEEYRESTNTIKGLQEEEEVLRERLASLEASLTKAKQKARKAKQEASELEDNNNTLVIQIDSLKKEMGRLQKALGSTETGDPTDLELCSREDISDLREENEQLSQSVGHLKKVIESKHKHKQKLETEHQRALQDLESRLQQEEGVITALKMELKGKDKTMQEMGRSMKELAAQSQELYDHNLSLQERNRGLEEVASSYKARLTGQLVTELTACVMDLQQLVELCNQGARGQEPNVSLLLGFRPSSVMSFDHDDDQAASEDLMKAKLNDVQKLRGEIDSLRNHISDKYAEDVGSNCITQ